MGPPNGKLAKKGKKVVVRACITHTDTHTHADDNGRASALITRRVDVRLISTCFRPLACCCDGHADCARSGPCVCMCVCVCVVRWSTLAG